MKSVGRPHAHPRSIRTLYLVIAQGIWRCVSPHCGSRWGAAAPGSFWVLGCTPSWVYWRFLLSWLKVRCRSFIQPLQSIFTLYSRGLRAEQINTCPPSYWRAVVGSQQPGCGTPAELGPTLPTGSPAQSATHKHSYVMTLDCAEPGPQHRRTTASTASSVAAHNTRSLFQAACVAIATVRRG